jgi:hypothetical protein
MPTNIDDKELERLEELSICGRGPFLDLSYATEISKVGPALVAEVRRLREKVEAWEWYGECFDNCKQRGKLPFEMHKTPSAYSEAWATLWAAREAVHADRE